MACFIAESYEPNPTATRVRVAAALRRAAAEVAAAGEDVRYIRSIVVPADETCFHVFESASVEAVREASVRARIVCTRIVEALE
jgi:hypothetical protein